MNETNVTIADGQASSLPGDPSRLFKLDIYQPNPASAVFQFTWCPTMAAINELKEKGVCYPYMFICIYELEKPGKIGKRRHYEYCRILERLDSGLVQIQFQQAGDFVAYANIIWNRDDAKESHQSAFLNLYCQLQWANHRRYIRNLASSYAYQLADIDSCFFILSHTDSLFFSVDSSFFAKAPSGRWAWLVEWGHFHRSKDQCQFRRRAFYSVLWKPLIMPLYAVWVMLLRILLSAIVLFVGMRSFNYRPLLHPFSMEIGDMLGDMLEDRVLSGAGLFWWLTKRVRDEDGYNSFPYRAFLLVWLSMPFAWVVTLAMAYFNWAAQDFTVDSWPSSVAIIMAWPLFGLAVFCLKRLVNFLLHRKMKDQETCNWQESKDEQLVKKKRRQQRAIEERRRLEAFYETRVEPLSCEVRKPGKRGLESLPETHRTFWMKVWDHKAKVCLPFQRRGAN